MIARFIEMTYVSNAILSILKLGFFGAAISAKAVPFAYFSILKKANYTRRSPGEKKFLLTNAKIFC